MALVPRGRTRVRGRPRALQHHVAPVKSLEKALRLLALFSPRTTQISINDMCKQLQIHRSVVYRLVVSLTAYGFLERADAHCYQVGKRAFEIGNLYVYGNSLVERAQPVLIDLVRATGWTAQLSVLDGTAMLVLATRESPAMVRAVADVGVRMPLHATAAGKAVLAHLPGRTLERLLGSAGLPAFTARTIMSMSVLRRELEKICRQGYAIHDGEWTEGLYGIGAPLFNHEGVFGAVVVAAPTSLLPSSDVEMLIEKTKRASEALSTFQKRYPDEPRADDGAGEPSVRRLTRTRRRPRGETREHA
jgi:DNA-binding IclR family transcriptional regulator